MGPIRELGPAALLSVKAEDVRALEEKVLLFLRLFVECCHDDTMLCTYLYSVIICRHLYTILLV